MLYKKKYRIESTRLKDWDYSCNGYYFITICIKNKDCFFGEIKNNKIILSKIGKIINKYLSEIPKHFSFVKLDEYIIMPNHIHLIIIIEKNGEINQRNYNNGREKAMPFLYPKHLNLNPIDRYQNQGKKTISSIIGSFKSICTKTINKLQDKINFAWQSGFYDHIIRDINDLNNIRKYIKYNHLKWDIDDENPNKRIKNE